GLGFLLVRPQLAALPLGRPLLAAGYLALTAAAAGLPAALRRRRTAGHPAAAASAGHPTATASAGHPAPAAAAAPHGPLPWPAVLAAGLAAVAAAALALRPVPAAPADGGAVLLGLAAAVAEEALFRRAVYGWLLARGGHG